MGYLLHLQPMKRSRSRGEMEPVERKRCRWKKKRRTYKKKNSWRDDEEKKKGDAARGRVTGGGFISGTARDRAGVQGPAWKKEK